MKDEYRRIRKIVDDYLRLVRRLLTGEGTVPKYVLQRLKLKGKKIEGLLPRMVRHGAARFPDGDAAAAEKNMREQVEAARIRVNLAIDSLRTRTLQTAQSAMAGAAGAALFVLAALALRRRREEFASDWSRTAQTEMHNAADSGSAAALYAYPDGDLTRVYKLCRADACTRCTEAYQNPDGTPKIFTIGELRANGTNVGRKPSEWKPVIGCMHPYCKCTLHLAP